MTRTDGSVAHIDNDSYIARRRMDVANSKTPTLAYEPRLKGSGQDPSTQMLSDRLLALADRHRYKLFALLVVIYLLGFNAQWRVEPDSALYLTMGRNVANGLGYTYNGQPQGLVFPGLPLLFAGIFKVFHTSSLVPALIVMMLIGLATLALTYRLFLLHSGRPTAVMITFGLGISRLFYRYNYELLSDMPFLMAVMAFLVGYEAIFYRRDLKGRKRWFDWVFLIGGLLLAISMRPSMWGLLVAIVLASVWSSIRGPYRIRHIIFCLTAIVAAIVFWMFDPRRNGGRASMGQYEDGLFEVTFAHVNVVWQTLIHQNIPKMFQATLSQALFGSRPGWGFSVVAGIAVLIISATMLLDRPLWVLWMAMTYGLMLFVIEPLDRYFLEVLPLLVFAWWRGIRWLNDRLPRVWSRRASDLAFITLFIIGGTTNLLRVGEFIYDQRQIPFLAYYTKGRYESLDRVASMVASNTNERDWILTTPQYARILAFLSHRKIIGPMTQVDLDPQQQQIFALDPLDSSVLQRLKQIGGVIGPQIGESVGNPYDAHPWQLHLVKPQ